MSSVLYIARVWPADLLAILDTWIACDVSATPRHGGNLVAALSWYPQEGWLAAFEEIAQQIGPRACFQIGRSIPRHAVFPPSVVDIYSAIASADIAYHLNHRKNGRVMFDQATGKKMTGIGNYGYEVVQGQKKIISVCDPLSL